MAGEDLKGLKVAVLATDGFEQVELMQPWSRKRSPDDLVAVSEDRSGQRRRAVGR